MGCEDSKLVSLYITRKAFPVTKNVFCLIFIIVTALFFGTVTLKLILRPPYWLVGGGHPVSRKENFYELLGETVLYQTEEGYFDSSHRYFVGHFSWRVRLLWMYDGPGMYDRIINAENIDFSQEPMEMPRWFEYPTISSWRAIKSSCIFMIPPLSFDQLISLAGPSSPTKLYPIFVGVSFSQYNWMYEDGDWALWHLLNEMPDNSKLTELRNEQFVLCEAVDKVITVSTSEGEVLDIPVTTTIGEFKRIIGIERIEQFKASLQ